MTERERECKAALRVGENYYACEITHPHRGKTHVNEEADAVWCSDGEARRYGKQEK